jgi:site-specific DNA-methyltransferase (adenine-specific)
MLKPSSCESCSLVNKLYVGDCLTVMPKLQAGSIDMILCDLPYGTTACSWDSIVDLDKLWGEYKRIIRPSSAIVLTASQPFTSTLVSSNYKMFKHEWIWQKAVGSNFASLKYQPMKEHESILVFGTSLIYNPIMQERNGSCRGKVPDYSNTNSPSKDEKGEVYGGINRNRDGKVYGELRNPSSVQYFNNRIPSDRGMHPTQKPIALFEYLIKTYTFESNVVLDNCCGSGTTGVACQNLGRGFILIEKDLEYAKIAQKRLIENAERLRNVKA